MSLAGERMNHMKKGLAILLALSMILALGACSGLQDLTIEPLPTPQQTATPAPKPEEPASETETPDVTDAPQQEPAELGSRVIVNIQNRTETFMAPDNDQQRILTFGYDTATVYIDGRGDSAEAINYALGVQDELYYSGTGNGDGLNGLLERATDNYAIAMETGEDMNLEFSSVRTASVARSDSRIVSMVYLTHEYTGGMHGYYFERGYVFDAESGERLSLESLAKDQEGFDGFVLDYMKTLAAEQENLIEYGALDDAGTALAALLREGSWYLNGEGLVIFSDVYEIASYADGIIHFTIPYGELAPYLNEKYLPIERQGEGDFSLALQSEVPAGTVEILDKVIVDKGGEDFCLQAVGTVYDVNVSSVNYVDDDHGFYQTAEHWTCSYMRDCAVQVETLVPEGMPNLMIRYMSADGTEHRFLLTQSGIGGGYTLTDDSIEAVG